ncbi:neurogenic locus notch homolog protein 1 isoform X1 [Lingula anatina]|uniref:Neurogenic locus notch homolog protein 1 isoform X1 n=1 Tax=Lingula anatina TaxID=7574 RepID=A0A1S3K3D9_LINAN|nr:neurogenic locus notch homolog protein 1 isoform X1 [Lingula anatina]|eukprot:XP_013416934.1 neurogenic locus notch homolog protein 1 isoform X1 [Lingula anatina]
MESLRVFALLTIVVQSINGFDRGSQYLKLMQLYSVNRQTNQLYTLFAKDCPEFLSTPDIAGVVKDIFGKRDAAAVIGSELDIKLALAKEHFGHLLQQYKECASKKGHMSGIDACSVNLCQNNGVCENVLGFPQCLCSQGFSGDKCQYDIDDCASNPCKNGGTCDDRVNGFQCTCLAGYTGTTCETNIDECTNIPCKNNGTCVDRVNGFQCTCLAGFTGTTCETDMDECTNNPCKNNGTCVDRVNGFQCTCLVDFTGTTCETTNYAFEVIDTKNVTYSGLRFLAVKVRVPANGKSASSDWCYDYRNMCQSFGRRPTGCGGRWISDSRYSRCRDVYSSYMPSNNQLDCNPSSGARALAMAAFNVTPPIYTCFAFHRCESSGDCSSTFASSGDGLTYVSNIMSKNDRVGYTVCY